MNVQQGKNPRIKQLLVPFTKYPSGGQVRGQISNSAQQNIWAGAGGGKRERQHEGKDEAGQTRLFIQLDHGYGKQHNPSVPSEKREK